MAEIRVLLTGATGFVGSHTAEALARRRIPTRALVRRTSAIERGPRATHVAWGGETLGRLGVELVQGDLGDQAALDRAVRHVDVVVHLAALTQARSAADYDRVNAAGTTALVRAMLDAQPRPRRLVVLSSLAAAGPSADAGVGPSDTPSPITAYGRSKLAGERSALAASGEVEVVVLRAPAVYGPRDRDLYRFFRLAARGVLPVPSGPARRLQLIHVEDLAAALVLATTAERAEGIMHAAESTAYTWEAVGGLVAAAVGRNARLVRIPAAIFNAAAMLSETASAAAGRSTIFNRDKARELLAPGWLCETDRARRILGFDACIPLGQGLRETAQWYRAEGWL